MSEASPAPRSAQRARQRSTLLILAFALIIGGLLILFVLKKVPPPLRILMGLSDLFAGLILLVVVRQKFKTSGPEAAAPKPGIENKSV
jgi:hypothetical protein